MTLKDMLTLIATQVRDNLYKWYSDGICYTAEVNPKNGCVQVSNGTLFRECYRHTCMDKVYAEFSIEL